MAASSGKSGDAKSRRQDRLAAALRQNLRRRKQQAKAKTGAMEGTADDAAGPPKDGPQNAAKPG